MNQEGGMNRMEAVRRALIRLWFKGGFTGRELEDKVEQMLGYKLTGETPLREARMLRSRGEINFRCVSRAESRYEFETPGRSDRGPERSSEPAGRQWGAEPSREAAQGQQGGEK